MEKTEIPENQGAETKRKRGGRKKGVPNRITSDIRNAISQAFSKAGGVNYLVEQSRLNPQAVLTLLGKIVPAEVKAQVEANLTVITGVPRADR